MPFFLSHIPLQAGELLDFNRESILCMGGMFVVGLLVLSLTEKWGRIGKKGRFRLLFLTVYCAACGIFVYVNGNRQEKDHRLQWAEKIASCRDRESEARFEEHAARISEDSTVLHLLSGSRNRSRRDSLADYLQRRCFLPAFRNYRCFFTFCRTGDKLLVENSLTADCRAFFSRKAEAGEPSGIPGLTVIDYGIEYYAYLYRQPLCISGDTLFLNVELGRKKFSDDPGGTGFHLPSAYSYAFYSDKDLWSHNGSFLYSFKLYSWAPDSLQFRNWKNFSHLFYPLPLDRMLIISTPEPDPVGILHNFSLFFLIFGLAGSVVLAVTDRNFLGTAGTYAQRLRTSMFVLILFVFAVFGTASIVFIRRIDRNENLKLLRNQSLSILAEMENRYLDFPANCLQDRSCYDSIALSLHRDLEELSNLFRYDIYLYSFAGKLISGPADRCLLPDSLSREIRDEILWEEQSHVLIKRRQFTETSDGLLAFTPFRNAGNEILGFFCIPYYTQADEWHSEMNRFLGTYLNIVVLLSLLTLGVATLLARRITKPLSLVARMVSQIRLTQKNEHLEWKRNDEIGILVRQYNRLVDELEVSSRKLAESERESAWSEMARQVAHEIKNPLTPMKLQVQQLQRAYQDGKSDFQDRLARFALMLTEQIDLLAHIAGTFSRFAQWQKPQMQVVHPVGIVQNIFSLFKADENVSFLMEIPADTISEETKIEADPNFLEQILINLVRNAVQALEEAGTDRPMIRIGVRFAEKDREVEVYVADNGPGIPPEKQERIFEPHFTTRSTGAGLGLAICRRLAESMDGRIVVESTAGNGACFKVFFKAIL